MVDFRLVGFLISRHEVYGYEKLICYGLKCITNHIFKGLSTEQDDENRRNCVCHSVSHRKYKHFMAIYTRCFTENILQNNSKGHWEVKIISMAAKGTKVTVSRCFLF